LALTRQLRSRLALTNHTIFIEKRIPCGFILFLFYYMTSLQESDGKRKGKSEDDDSMVTIKMPRARAQKLLEVLERISEVT
jgi:hypothetical protein